MIIEIIDREFAESEALQTALVRTLWHQNVSRVTIFVNPRDKEGWLEYGLKFEYTTGGQMFVGMIQRNPGASYEFHS